MNNVASANEDFYPRFPSCLSQIESEYRVFRIKRYLHLSSFFLCSICVNATLVLCKITAILGDVNITKHQCGSRGKGKKLWTHWDAKTCCLTFPCRQSLKTNPSKSYIKKSDIFPLQRGKFGPLQLSTETLNKLCLHGIVRSHLYLSEFTFVATMAPIPWTHVAIL